MNPDDNLYSASATTCWAAVLDRWLRGVNDLKTIEESLYIQKLFSWLLGK
jgi:hypothetical protein